jgi:5-methylcytosine-specific restriction endonuclease McrA
MVLWLTERGREFPYHTNEGQRVLAIFLVIFALIILLGSRTKKPIPWKKYKGIRRHFSGEVRQQVLDAQKYKCANCNLSISQPLVHHDHIDGNHANNDISNCQALCPNCHSLKTDDDRRNQ